VRNPPANPVAPLADCPFITGPTASGKTTLALDVARRLNAEILSLDSMAVYRGLDIGTAKPSLEERRQVSHHLIDLVEPDEEFSLAQYLSEATRACQAIRARGCVPLFVGGTPLYLKALLRGIFEGPQADWEFRRRILAEAEQLGNNWLHERVAQVDPQAAQRLHRHDTRRLVRALEVFEKTGRPISDWQRQFDRARPACECAVFVLDWPRDELYRRIEARVDAMFAGGLIDEVGNLLAAGKNLGRTARQAVGYREVLEHLAGQRNLADTIDLVKTRTRQFAKRQLTWFRSLSECRWIGTEDACTTSDIATEISNRGTT
jgi:tRNA dimethylallyltransferase